MEHKTSVVLQAVWNLCEQLGRHCRSADFCAIVEEQSPDESGSYAQGMSLQAMGHAELKPDYKGVLHKSRQECSTTLGKGANGEDRTMYSLRHTCIMYRLRYGEKMDVITVARNARTSDVMTNKMRHLNAIIWNLHQIPDTCIPHFASQTRVRVLAPARTL